MEQFKPGTVLNDRFEVFDSRQGGMGYVLFCHDKKAKKDIALKTYLDTALSPETAEKRFIREAEAWIRIGKRPFLLVPDQIVKVYSRPYLLMPYCKRGSLRDLLATRSFQNETVVLLATQLAIGLIHLNELCEMTHRDLKPENVLIADDKSILITDLGLVKFQQAEHFAPINLNTPRTNLTVTGGFMGTMHYASPEQLLDSSSVDMRTDIWAWGVLVFELILGHPPFLDTSSNELARSILLDQPRNWSMFEAGAGPILSTIVARCFAKNPKDRFQTPSDLCRALDALIIPGGSACIPSSSKSQNRDDRIPIEDKIIEATWRHLFPERTSGVDSSLNVEELASGSRAAKLRTLGKYTEALAECEKVLGRLDDPQSNLSLLIKGESNENPVIEISPLRYRFKAPPLVIAQALELKMVLYIDLIEREPNESEMVRRYTQDLYSLALAITSGVHISSSIDLMCAQAFLKAGQYDQTIAICKGLVQRDKKNGRYWWPYLVALNLKGDQSARDNLILNELLPALASVNNNMAQRICGKALIIIQEWKYAANAFQVAYSLDKNDIESLFDACGSAISGYDLQLASVLYAELLKVAPKSPYAASLRKFFGREQGLIASISETQR